MINLWKDAKTLTTKYVHPLLKTLNSSHLHWRAAQVSFILYAKHSSFSSHAS
jgi:hypothetical protein